MTVIVPLGVDEPEVRVRVLVEVVGFGLKLAVMPCGNPEAFNVTLPENPSTGVTVIVLVPIPFGSMVSENGAAVRSKVGPITVRLTDVLVIKLLDCPLISRVEIAGTALPLAVKVNLLTVLVASGLKVAVIPMGKFEAERVTVPLKPFSGLTFTVPVTKLPSWSVKLPRLEVDKE